METELTRTTRCRSWGQRRCPSVWRCQTWPDRTTLAAVWSRWIPSLARICTCWRRSTASITRHTRLINPFQVEQPVEVIHGSGARGVYHMIEGETKPQQQERGRELNCSVAPWSVVKNTAGIWFVYRQAAGDVKPTSLTEPRFPGQRRVLHMALLATTHAHSAFQPGRSQCFGSERRTHAWLRWLSLSHLFRGFWQGMVTI